MVINQGGGILINSINKLFLLNVVLVFCLFSVACASEIANIDIKCIEKNLGVKVVRIDNNNQRLFIVNENISSEYFISKLDKIKSCLDNSGWGGDWAISIFNKAECAGYKDEKKIIPLHKNNEWAKAYKMEYSNSSGVLIEDPVLNPKYINP